MNIQGYDSINEVMKRGSQALTADNFEMVANETHALILDIRSAEDFAKGFIPEFH